MNAALYPFRMTASEPSTNKDQPLVILGGGVRQRLRAARWVFRLALSLLGTIASAEDDGPGSSGTAVGSAQKKEGDGQIVVVNSGAFPQAPLTASAPSGSAAVIAILQKLQSDRDAFLKQQKALQLQLSAANGARRAEVREQLRENLDHWIADQKELQQDIRDTERRLQIGIASHSEMIAQAKEATQSHRKK